MHVIARDSRQVLLRFDTDEEVFEGLKGFARKETLPGAIFTAIGTAKTVTLAFFNGESKTYEEKSIEEDLEIASLTGNLGWLGDAPIVHAHGVFSDQNMATRAGHVQKLTASFTCEVMLTFFENKISRARDPGINLNLLKNK